MKMKVAGYIRVSTRDQVEKGESLKTQEKQIKDFVRLKDWKLVKIYRDEGISGFKAEKSSVFAWNSPVSSATLSWKADVPEKARLEFAVRAAESADGLSKIPWQTVAGDTFPLRAKDRCLQYRATLISEGGDRYPVLDLVRVAFCEALSG